MIVTLLNLLIEYSLCVRESISKQDTEANRHPDRAGVTTGTKASINEISPLTKPVLLPRLTR